MIRLKAALLVGIFSFSLSGGLAGTLSAAEVLPGPVTAKVLRVIDGDTLVVSAQVWLGQRIETKLRLYGIDTPELRSRCSSERELAARAKALVERLSENGQIVIRNIQFGKFAGRVLGQVETAAGENFADSLIQSGLARAYSGGKRLPWCPA